MKLSSGTVHRVPKDLLESLTNSKSIEIWNSLTELGRNEYICWVTSAKKSETRDKRISRTLQDLTKGKRRPCCWAGCPHRVKKQS